MSKTMIRPCQIEYVSAYSLVISSVSNLLVVILILSQLFSVSSQTCGLPLPPSTTSIPINAYQGCTSISSVTIPSTVTFIGEKLLCNIMLDFTTAIQNLQLLRR